MVGGATLLSLVLRRVLTPEWIEAESFAFDGATALVLLAFLLPVFDGIGALLIAEPVAWLRMLGFVLVLNFGASCVTILLARLRMNSPDAGALGIMWGNRNVGIYFAALPLAGQDLQLAVQAIGCRIYVSAPAPSSKHGLGRGEQSMRQIAWVVDERAGGLGGFCISGDPHATFHRQHGCGAGSRGWGIE